QSPGDVGSNAIEPIADQFLAAQGGRFVCQHEKGDLESILGILDLMQNPSTNAQDHRRMPAHQCRKGGLVAVLNEPVQKLFIRRLRAGGRREPAARVLQKNIAIPGLHEGAPPKEWALPLYSALEGNPAQLFTPRL